MDSNLVDSTTGEEEDALAVVGVGAHVGHKRHAVHVDAQSVTLGGDCAVQVHAYETYSLPHKRVSSLRDPLMHSSGGPMG